MAEPTPQQQPPLSPRTSSRRSHGTQSSLPVKIYPPHTGKHITLRHVSFTPYPDPPPKSASPEKPPESEESPNSPVEPQASPSQSDNSDVISSGSSSGPTSSLDQEAVKTEPSRSSSRPPLRLPRIKNVFISKRRKTATVSDSEVTDTSSLSPSINSKGMLLYFLGLDTGLTLFQNLPRP